jgi:hypothetical protein
MHTRFWSENLKGRDHLEDLSVDGILGKLEGRCGLDASGSGKGPVMGSCEHNNELSGSIKIREFLD